MSTLRKARKLRRNPTLFVYDYLGKRLDAQELESGFANPRSRSNASNKSRVALQLDKSIANTGVISEIHLNGFDTKCFINFDSYRFKQRNQPAYFYIRDSKDRLALPEDVASISATKTGAFDYPGTEFIDIIYGPEAMSWSPTQQLAAFSHAGSVPHTWPLASLNGFMMVHNPATSLPFLLRASWPGLKLLTILNPLPTKSDPVWQYVSYSDALIVNGGEEEIFVDHHCFHQFSAEEDLPWLVRTVVQTLTPSKIDAFVALIYSHTERLPPAELDPAQPYDILIQVRSMPDPLQHGVFSDVLDDLFSNIEVLLVRESLVARYATLVERRQHRMLFKMALRDGARLHISEGGK